VWGLVGHVANMARTSPVENCQKMPTARISNCTTIGRSVLSTAGVIKAKFDCVLFSRAIRPPIASTFRGPFRLWGHPIFMLIFPNSLEGDRPDAASQRHALGLGLLRELSLRPRTRGRADPLGYPMGRR
jgi:hypothetical protein